MKEDVELISYNNENKGILFQIGFLKIVLMPLTSTIYQDIVFKFD
jgi:hypothetical protein